MAITVMPTPCVIEIDPGVDDSLALLLALASPELLVVSIALTHGNTTLPSALINLSKIFYALEQHLARNPAAVSKWPGVDLQRRRELGLGPIEVLLGSEGPIKDEDAVTAKYFHGLDGLSNIDQRHPSLTPSSPSPFYSILPLNTTDGLPILLSSYPPSTIAYLALGPLTSLANLHASDSSLLSQFGLILVMGGAIAVPGNTSPTAEFNTYADPYAAQVIFSLALPTLYLFPLDLTSTLTLPFDMYTSLVDPAFKNTSSPSVAGVGKHGKSALAHFTSAFLESTVEVMKRYGSDEMEMHDPAVVWAMIDWARYQQSLARGSPGSRDGLTESERTVMGLEVRRGSEMRRRIEVDGFTRSVIERRRSVELAKMAKLQRDAAAMSVERAHELAFDGDDLGILEADEQDGQVEEEEEEEEEEDNELSESGHGVLAPGWEWAKVAFEVETTGTLTRGMMVVDRRVSATAPAGLETRQTNRALAIEEVEAREAAADDFNPANAGTKVIISSPGHDTLRALLLERIWGVAIGLP